MEVPDLKPVSDGSEKARKLEKAVLEFGGYIRANREFIPNYGDRWRNKERISTGFVESTVNQVVAKRIVKKQQMSKGRFYLKSSAKEPISAHVVSTHQPTSRKTCPA